jgi:hypothetical protein
MNNTFNIYYDESCHLENDHINVMALGAVWCKWDDIEEITNTIKKFKNPEPRVYPRILALQTVLFKS